MAARTGGRRTDQLRPLSLEVDAAPYAEGSCLVATGQTRVLCTASVTEGVPEWRERSGAGWVTAEYAMLPRATHTRTRRERDGVKGRTQEIQRLIGRSLRSVVDLRSLGARTVTVDCDVLQADGGTRTASITGACVALTMAGAWLLDEGLVERNPVRQRVAAVSVGLVDGEPRLDLDYGEDSTAQVDMNVVATERLGLVEVQGTAEGDPFPRSDLDRLLDLALAGIEELLAAQAQALKRG
ncbi:MAG: ribonuclease PH [Gemmatimonadetes bacterium]|nr:ribonuclease PH [Gemmatimonadota bacterium]